MKIYLVRHAESVYNARKILQGRIDCELSEKGINDTKEQAKCFLDEFDVVFCSPLKRTKQTAEILFPNNDIIYDERIIERSLGEWEGTPNTDEKQFFLKNKVLPPKGESFLQIDERVKSFFDMLKREYVDKKVLLVTHGGVINAIFRVLKVNAKPVDNLELVEVDI